MRPEHAVGADEVGAEERRELAAGGAPQEVHLEEPLLGMHEPEGAGGVGARLGADPHHAQAVALDAHGLGQPRQRRIAFQLRPRGAHDEPSGDDQDDEENGDPDEEAGGECFQRSGGGAPEGIGRAARAAAPAGAGGALLDSISSICLSLMPAHNVYHVVPRDGRWVARLQGSPSVSAEADRRDDAVEAAERIIRQLGTGRIVIHGDDGAIESVHTFEQILAEREKDWSDSLLSKPLLIGIAAACLVGVGFALAGRR